MAGKANEALTHISFGKPDGEVVEIPEGTKVSKSELGAEAFDQLVASGAIGQPEPEPEPAKEEE